MMTSGILIPVILSHRDWCSSLGSMIRPALVSPKWLITSFSCLSSNMDPLEWVLFGGPSGYNPSSTDQATQIRTVKKVVPHPLSRRGLHLTSHNIALVELQEPLALNQQVNAICLAEEDIQTRQLCVTAGWTSGEQEGVSFNQYLTYLPVPSLDLTACNSSTLYNGHITHDQVCSYSNGDSQICHDDEGAPLMCITDSGVWQLYGVLSSHGGCRGQNSRPAVFTSLPSVKAWVDKTVGSSFLPVTDAQNNV